MVVSTREVGVRRRRHKAPAGLMCSVHMAKSDVDHAEDVLDIFELVFTSYLVELVILSRERASNMTLAAAPPPPPSSPLVKRELALR